MSIMWSLVNISKEQQFSLMLYALCLIVQWSCHCSAKEQATLANPNITTAKNISAQSDVPSTTKSILDKSGGLNTSTENPIFELSNDQGNATTPILQSSKSTRSKLHYTETTVIPGADSGSSNGKTGEIPKMQTEGRHNKASQPVVLISLIFCGLFLAATIMAVYYRLNKRTWSPNSKRLDEEPDAQDHDSTMFSVTSEDQSDAHEKPKLNGEAQENGENQRATAGEATGNGHQRKKAEEADTEL